MRTKEFHFYFEPTNKDGLSDIAKIDFCGVKFENQTLTISLKAEVNHTRFYFVEKTNGKGKYKVRRSDSTNDFHIVEVDKPLTLKPIIHRIAKKAYYLEFDFSFEGGGNSKEYILDFEIPLVHLNDIEGKYFLMIKGFKHNEKSIEGLPQPVTEEGIIIFEPPT